VVDGNNDGVHLFLEVKVEGVRRSGRSISKSPFEVDINS
jgi:hypothetical protein